MLGTIIGLLGVLVALMGLKEGAIRNSFKKVGKFLDDFYSYIDFPRRILNRRINSQDFLSWQDAMLRKMYTDKDNEDKYFTTILGRTYPVYRLDFDEDYVFDNDCEFDNVDKLCTLPNENVDNYCTPQDRVVKIPDIYDTEIMNQNVATDAEAIEKEEALKKKLMRRYKWFTKRSMPDGNHIGYTLDHLEFDDNKKIKKIYLSIGDYKLTLLTSHIMTYEFYKAYHKLLKKKDDIYDVNLKELWPMLPFRRYIDKANDFKVENVLSKGLGRNALLSVQCLVILCTEQTQKNIKYKCFLGKRSNSTRSVSTKLGCYQFPPSGGFDLYDVETGVTRDIIMENCSLSLALMREYLEEILGDERFKRVDVANGYGPLDAIRDVREGFENIKNLLRTPLNNNRFKENTTKAYFTTVGTNVDLIDLRLSVNFLLVINDDQFYVDNRNTFKYNDELKEQNFLIKLLNKNKKERMLYSWSAIDDRLRNERKIVEDSVALYEQGKRAFRNYLDRVLVDKSCIGKILNDTIGDNFVNEESKKA